MPDASTSETETRRGWALSAMAWGLGLIIAYALSPGPVLALWKNPPVGISAFSMPLEAMYQSVPFVHDFYDWYFTLWGIKLAPPQRGLGVQNCFACADGFAQYLTA